jgi:hypothetical protein
VTSNLAACCRQDSSWNIKRKEYTEEKQKHDGMRGGRAYCAIVRNKVRVSAADAILMMPCC